MKKGIVALALIFGFYFVHAQDNIESMPDKNTDTEKSIEYGDYNFDTEETNTDADLKKSEENVVTGPEEITETGSDKVNERTKMKKDNSEIVPDERVDNIQNERTFEVKAEDDKYKYNSSYDSEESSNSTDTDYMYIR